MSNGFTVKLEQLYKVFKKRSFRAAWNRLWFYALWESKFLKRLFLTKFFPWGVPFPPLLEFETTTRCNLKCIMCEHTYWNEKCNDVTFEQFKDVVNQFKLRWIGVTGIGESFMNKDFMKMLGYVKKQDIYVELFDTFYFVNENIAWQLLNMGVDRIIISFDAATKETYEKIRVNSDFDLVVENIRTIFRLKKKMKEEVSEIYFHFIISKPNVHEVPQYIDLVNALRQGEDTYIMFTPLLHVYDEINDIAVDVPGEIIEETHRKAKAAGIGSGWNQNAEKEKLEEISKCTSWIMPFIFSSGEVIPCCVGNEANKRSFQKKFSFGNIYKQKFKDIWNSKLYREFREKIHRGETPVQCRDCSIFKANYTGNEENDFVAYFKDQGENYS